MSWDIYIMNFPAAIRRVADIPKDFQAVALGKRADLIAQIKELIPSANFSDPKWGVFDGDGYSIEFQMGSAEDCNGITLYVRGGGKPIPLIVALLKRLNARGIDFQTSEFFDAEAAQASFGAWQEWRDRAFGGKENTGSKDAAAGDEG